MSNSASPTEWMVSLVATYLLHSTLVIAVVGCITCRLSNPLVLERLWKFALVAGLITAPLQLLVGGTATITLSLPAAASVARQSPAEGTSSATDGDVVTLPSIAAESFQPIVVETMPQSGPEAPRALPAPTTDVPQRCGQPTAIPWTRCLVGMAVAWLAWVTCRTTWAICRLRREVTTARPVVDGVGADCLAEILSAQQTQRRIGLFVTARACEPIACGWLRWNIVLPARCLDELDRDAIYAILSHEVAHLVRGDVWWKTISHVVCWCLPVQPLNAFAKRQWQRAAEQLCDDWAVDRGASSLALARCLTTIVEWNRCPPASHAVAVGMASPPLVQRVERLIQQHERPDRWRTPAGRRLLSVTPWIIVGVLGLCIPSIVLSRGPEEPAVEFTAALDTRPIQHSLEEELSLLTAEIERVEQLLSSSNDPQLRMLADQLRSRAESLVEKLETVLQTNRLQSDKESK